MAPVKEGLGEVRGGEGMDPRERADALLSRAQARAGVVTPDNMVSPMDASNTQQIPRSVVRRIDDEDPDATAQVPSSVIEDADSHLNATATTTRLDPLPRNEPAAGRATAAAPAPEPEPEVEETEVGGILPTTRTRKTKSDMARRLEGL